MKVSQHWFITAIFLLGLVLLSYVIYDELGDQSAKAVQDFMLKLIRGISDEIKVDTKQGLDKVNGFWLSTLDIEPFVKKVKEDFPLHGKNYIISKITILDKEHKQVYSSDSTRIAKDFLKSLKDKPPWKDRTQEFYTSLVFGEDKHWHLMIIKPLFKKHDYQGVCLEEINKLELLTRIQRGIKYFKELNIYLIDSKKQIIVDSKDNKLSGCNRLKCFYVVTNSKTNAYFNSLFSGRSGKASIEWDRFQHDILAFTTIKLTETDFWIMEASMPYYVAQDSVVSMRFYISFIILLVFIYIAFNTFLSTKSKPVLKKIDEGSSLDRDKNNISTELELYRSEVNTILRTTDSPIFIVTNKEGRIYTASTHLLSILGENELMGIIDSPIESIFAADEEGMIAELYTNMENKRNYLRKSSFLLTKEKQSVSMKLIASPILDESNELLAVLIQLSEQSKIKEQLLIREREGLEDYRRLIYSRFGQILERINAIVEKTDTTALTPSELSLSTTELLQLMDKHIRWETRSASQKLSINAIISNHCGYWYRNKDIRLKLDERVPPIKGSVSELSFLIDLVIMYLDSHLLANVRERQISTSFDLLKIYVSFAFYGYRVRSDKAVAKGDTTRLQTERLKRILGILEWYDASWNVKEVGDEETVLTISFPTLAGRMQHSRESIKHTKLEVKESDEKPSNEEI